MTTDSMKERFPPVAQVVWVTGGKYLQLLLLIFPMQKLFFILLYPV